MVGAGIIGLTSAFRLARAGHPVTLLDPSPARGATWAAAGMIAPSAEIAPGEEANYHLQLGALASWRELAAELKDVTGEELDIVERGTLLVGWDASDRRLIDQYAQVAHSFGATLEPLERAQSPEQFEGLSPRISEAWATSTTLAAAVRKMADVDIILCGKQAVDGDTAQVGPEMAALLDIPYATFVKKIEVALNGSLEVVRQTDEGTEAWRLRLPALLTVIKEIGEPRIPSLRHKIAQKRPKSRSGERPI